MNRITNITITLMLVLGLVTGCGKGTTTTVASINGATITNHDLQTRMQIFELFFKQPMTDAATKTQLLDQMVRERLLLSEAAKLNVVVEPAQVELEMTKFFAALERQHQGRAEVEAKVKTLELTNDQIAAFLRDFLTTQAVVEKKKAETQVSPAEVREFYEENRSSIYTFTTDVVRAQHILVPADQEELAKELVAKVRNGGDFAVLAREYSVDPGSARKGGDLGYFTMDTMVPEFAKAAFSLPVGEVSDPVKSPFGWHVIKVEDKQQPGTLSFDQVQEDALGRLLPQKQDAAFEQWVAGLEKDANVSKATMHSEKGSEK